MTKRKEKPASPSDAGWRRAKRSSWRERFKFGKPSKDRK